MQITEKALQEKYKELLKAYKKYLRHIDDESIENVIASLGLTSENINFQDENGNTLTHLALHDTQNYYWYGLLPELIELGADIFLLNNKKESAFSLAYAQSFMNDFKKYDDLVEWVEAYYANVQRGNDVFSPVEHPAEVGLIVLNAAKSKKFTVAKRACDLLSDSCLMQGMQNWAYEGNTVLHYAVLHGEKESWSSCGFFLKSGADPLQKNTKGETALDIAVGLGGKLTVAKEIMQYMLTTQPDPLVVGKSGESLFHAVKRINHPVLINIVLLHALSINKSLPIISQSMLVSLFRLQPQQISNEFIQALGQSYLKQAHLLSKITNRQTFIIARELSNYNKESSEQEKWHYLLNKYGEIISSSSILSSYMGIIINQAFFGELTFYIEKKPVSFYSEKIKAFYQSIEDKLEVINDKASTHIVVSELQESTKKEKKNKKRHHHHHNNKKKKKLYPDLADSVDLIDFHTECEPLDFSKAKRNECVLDMSGRSFKKHYPALPQSGNHPFNLFTLPQHPNKRGLEEGFCRKVKLS